MNLNRATVLGRMTKDPELRSTPGGQSVSTFSIATNRIWTDKEGKKQDDSQFHNIVVWGRQAEVVNQFVTKGQTILVEGRLQTREYTDKQGVVRRVTEIIAENVQFGPKMDAQRPSTQEAVTVIHVETGEVTEEQLPF